MIFIKKIKKTIKKAMLRLSYFYNSRFIRKISGKKPLTTVVFDFSDEDYDKMVNLMKNCGMDTKSELFNEVLSFYEFILSETEKNGYTVNDSFDQEHIPSGILKAHKKYILKQLDLS